jgi:hypothetical protein
MNGLANQMSEARKICSIGHKLRKKNNLPNSLPLEEIQFEGCFLWKGVYELIAEELNCRNINPFFCFEKDEKWDTEEQANLKVALRTDITAENQAAYDRQRAYRKKMMAEMRAGTYNEMTYKKYKH